MMKKHPGKTAGNNEHSQYSVKGGARSPNAAPKIGGGMKKGDDRSKSYSKNIKPQKSC
jgi:hypothetical protein